MKFKKLIAIVLAVTSMLSVSALAVSAAPSTSANVTVKVDGKVVDFPDQEPTIVNDRTLVPVRFIAESLGYDVEWDPADNSAVIDGGKIIMYIGTNKAKINGQNVTLDVASTLINDHTMVPLRVIAETLNCTVDWFGTNR
ncbi:MAG: copper amine oxidase N-terminal domain-containing protein, partial [Lachnospiraceae bacterium]|nr:copper amine oxidase N-terminal domain-containing protein [Lachnospiraceae bacterium]